MDGAAVFVSIPAAPRALAPRPGNRCAAVGPFRTGRESGRGGLGRFAGVVSPGSHLWGWCEPLGCLLGGGLQSRSGEPRGFEIAGADGRYFAAQAKIDGGAVTLSVPEVKVPESVRYAWANAPESDLFNRTGLPAAPFRISLSSHAEKAR